MSESPPGNEADSRTPPRFQFRIRTLLLAALFVGLGMSCYKCYRYFQEGWRYQCFVRDRFPPLLDEVRVMLNENAFSDRGRRLLDEMGASEDSGNLLVNCPAIVTVENESPQTMRAYVFYRSGSALPCDSPLCVITDGSRRALYWFWLEDLHTYVSARELSFVGKGDKHILVLDTMLYVMHKTRTIVTYTLTTAGVESVRKQERVAITPEWLERVSVKEGASE